MKNALKPEPTAKINKSRRKTREKPDEITHFSLTKWTATSPVTKEIRISSTGEIEKVSTASQLYDGSVKQLALTQDSFCDLLNNAGVYDCLSYGIPIDDNISRVMSKRIFNASEDNSGRMTRTADRMHWPEGNAVFMLDYDPEDGKPPLTRRQLLDAMYKVMPTLKCHAHIWAVSTSSCLFDTATKKEVRGVGGQRIYITVSSGSDIPRAGHVLFKKLWLAGLGYIKISRAGAQLARTIIDKSVYQSNKIDYISAPICEPPLESRKPKAETLGGTDKPLDTRTALPDLTESEEKLYQDLVKAAKASSQVEAESIKDAHVKARIAKMVELGTSPELAEKTIRNAIDSNVLQADFVLHPTEGKDVTVSELLSDKEKYHAMTFSDPIEPDYHGDKRVAKANLLGVVRPNIFSFAHGGQSYFLAKQLSTIQISKGIRADVIDKIIIELKKTGQIYSFATNIVKINDDSSITILDEYSLMSMIDRHVGLLEYNAKGKAWLPCDIKIEFAKIILHAHVNDFSPLKAIFTAPNIDIKTGEVLYSAGYDVRHAIFITNTESFVPVPVTPSLDDVKHAISSIWFAVHQFPFDSKIDQTVMFAAICTAVVRKMLPTAPGFGFDSPIQGSGKTLLAKVLAVVAGSLPTISPQPDKASDDEMRKRIFACLLEGASVLLVDNILGTFDSPAMAALLTSENYSDRVLGKSKTKTALNRMMTLLSGNNLTLVGDMVRRFLISRIDPKNETPHQRDFDFDPVQVVTEYRQEIVSAVLTLMVAFKNQAGTKRYGAGRLASFEDWDDLVRQTICWLVELQKNNEIPSSCVDGNHYPELVDPMEAINSTVKHDPYRERHSNLLKAIVYKYGAGSGRGNQFTVRHLCKDAEPDYGNFGSVPQFGDDNERESLSYLLVEVAGDAIKHIVNPRSLGKYFSTHADRIVDGLCLRKGPDSQNAASWWIEDVAGGLSGFGGLNNGQFEINSTQHTRVQSSEFKPTKPTKAISTRIPHATVIKTSVVSNNLGVRND